MTDFANPAAAGGKTPPASAPMQSPWVQLRSVSMNPFIYDRMLGHVDPSARPGDAVQVYDRDRHLFGRGLFNPRSKIALRMLVHGDQPVDDAFWQSRLASAVALRGKLRLPETTDAYRLVHAEGDGLSGLIVERYAGVLVFEVFSLGIFQRLEEIRRILLEILPKPTSLDRPDRTGESWQTFVRADESVERMEGFRAQPPETPPSKLIVREHGIRYRVDVAGGQKTGFFCDQRENRRRLATLCRDAEILDLCCYSGGFSLCAKLLGGAREVTAVDLDEAALALAKENANLNQARIHFAHADAFVYLRQMNSAGRQFDAVVLDPPKLALARSGLEDAMRKYYDLNTLAMQAVRPGGFLVTCSCSGLVSPDAFTDVVFRAARRARRSVQLLDFTGAGADHPVMPSAPQSAYLKAMWLRVL